MDDIKKEDPDIRITVGMQKFFIWSFNFVFIAMLIFVAYNQYIDPDFFSRDVSDVKEVIDEENTAEEVQEPKDTEKTAAEILEEMRANSTSEDVEEEEKEIETDGMTAAEYLEMLKNGEDPEKAEDIDIYSGNFTITIENFEVEEDDIHIEKGTTVFWKNKDQFIHVIAIRDIDNPVKSTGPNETYNFTFDSSGEYDWFSTPKPVQIKGKINVVDG